jgi:hypothetical protein
MGVFFLFLLAASAGCLSTLYWVPEDDLGRGYFLMNGLVVLCLLGLAAALWWLHPFHPFGDGGRSAAGVGALAAAVLGAFGYYAAAWRERWRLGRWAATLSLAGAASALLVCGAALTPESPIPYHSALLASALLLSAVLIGWSLVTMLLGHWYLVAPRLTFRHLTLFCWVLLAAVVARALHVAAALLLTARVGAALDPHPWRLLTGFGGEGPFFWFRLLWGLVLPLALALMSLHCARRRANQSATGILYVLVVGVFIGEITAYYLMLATGVPV